MHECAEFVRVPVRAPWASLLAVSLLCGGIGGCAPRKVESGDVTATAPQASPAVATPVADAPPGEKSLPALNGSGPKEPLVGGCSDLCSNPRAGFEGFMRALLLENAPKGLAFVRFVDTSILVDNGAGLGEQWATWFTQGKLPERQGGIDAWVLQMAQRVGGKVIPDVLEAALGSAVVMQRHSSTSVKFEMVVPDRAGSANGSTWRVMVSRRGLEWLVSEIQDAP